jgi:hypothetical protein
MSSARGNDKAASSNEYEQLKLENIERNKRRMAELNIPELVNSMAQQDRAKRICKVRCKFIYYTIYLTWIIVVVFLSHAHVIL